MISIYSSFIATTKIGKNRKFQVLYIAVFSYALYACNGTEFSNDLRWIATFQALKI